MITDEDLEDQDEENEPPTRVSFFSQGDRADELVCRAVWNMFTKASNAHGIAVRPDAVMTRTFMRDDDDDDDDDSEEETMVTNKRGELAATVLENYRAFERENGAAPTPSELFARIGEEVAVSVQNVRMAVKRLADRGELSGDRPKSAKQPKAPRARKAGPASSKDAVIGALIARRDAFRQKADALDVAIEALTEAS